MSFGSDGKGGSIDQTPTPKVVYFEGMLSASGVFTEVGYKRGDLTEEQYELLKVACNPILDGVIPKAAFWLRPTVDICMERIKKRGREIEDGIQRDYIKALRFISTSIAKCSLLSR